MKNLAFKSILLAIAIASVVETAKAEANAGSMHTNKYQTKSKAENREASYSTSYSVQDVIQQAVSATPEVAFSCAPIFEGIIGSPFVRGYTRENAEFVSSQNDQLYSNIGTVIYLTNSGLFGTVFPENQWTVNPSQVSSKMNARLGSLQESLVFLVSGENGYVTYTVSMLLAARACADAQLAAAREIIDADLSHVASLKDLIRYAGEVMQTSIAGSKGKIKLVAYKNLKTASQYKFSDGLILHAEAPPSMSVALIRSGAIVFDASKLEGADYKITLKKSGGAVVVK